MSTQDTNRLFPVFLKLEEMQVLIVGGGYVALEKLSAILANAPGTTVHLVAPQISEELRALATNYPKTILTERVFLPADLDNADIVLIAVNDRSESSRIRLIAKEKGKLVNVADQPALCDFYLGSIVQKGNLKLAISTNGKSPTIAKRLRALLNEWLPDELDSVLEQMHRIRHSLQGDFAGKVRQLNRITHLFASKGEREKKST
jgi:siroheme synthase-like protein